jgi:hypothetical protein
MSCWLAAPARAQRRFSEAIESGFPDQVAIRRPPIGKPEPSRCSWPEKPSTGHSKERFATSSFRRIVGFVLLWPAVPLPAMNSPIRSRAGASANECPSRIVTGCLAPLNSSLLEFLGPAVASERFSLAGAVGILDLHGGWDHLPGIGGNAERIIVEWTQATREPSMKCLCLADV